MERVPVIAVFPVLFARVSPLTLVYGLRDDLTLYPPPTTLDRVDVVLLDPVVRPMPFAVSARLSDSLRLGVVLPEPPQ